MGVDIRWNTTSSKEVNEPGEGSQHLTSLVRGGVNNSFLELAGMQTRRARSRLIGEGLHTLVDSRSETVAGGGTGPGGKDGGVDWGCFDCWTAAEGEARPSDVRALTALLYWPFCIVFVVRT